jgi:hypothetical protein
MLFLCIQNFRWRSMNSGVQYLKRGEAAKAVEPLRSASKLSPDAFTSASKFRDRFARMSSAR